MPPTSLKNLPLSPASTALGLGDALLAQSMTNEDEVRKKMLTDQGLGLSASATTLLGPMGA